jgi:hypothetical protein
LRLSTALIDWIPGSIGARAKVGAVRHRLRLISDVCIWILKPPSHARCRKKSLMAAFDQLNFFALRDAEKGAGQYAFVFVGEPDV